MDVRLFLDEFIIMRQSNSMPQYVIDNWDIFLNEYCNDNNILVDDFGEDVDQYLEGNKTYEELLNFFNKETEKEVDEQLSLF